jgi:outer membrane lipoprotein-sorting protein
MKIFYISLIILFVAPVFAESPEKRGHTILVEADRRASGFKDYTVSMEMVLRNHKKQESKRTIRSKVLEVKEDGDTSLTIFDSPKDVRGTALLTVSHKYKDDDQWLYLPAITRVKRISSSNRSGSFMGSEFAFEDLSSREIEKYDSIFLREEECANHTCFVVELYPKNSKSSGYSRIISWIDSEEYRVHKEEYYDKKDRLYKTLTITKHKLYMDTIWKPHRLAMVNHLNGKETDLIMSDYRFHSGLSASDFSVNSLKRYR